MWLDYARVTELVVSCEEDCGGWSARTQTSTVHISCHPIWGSPRTNCTRGILRGAFRNEKRRL